MKYFIKFILIFLVCCIPTWVIFDDVIIKSVIIQLTQKATKKKTNLASVKITYFPELSLTLNDFQCPNPMQQNYVLSAKKLRISIDASALLHQSLVINDIVSMDAIFFDTSSPVYPIKNTVQESSEEPKKTMSIPIKKLFDSAMPVISNSSFANDMKDAVDFSKETDDINAIISSAEDQMLSNKNQVLKSLNNSFFELNGLNVSNVSSLDDIRDIQKKLTTLDEDLNQISNKIDDTSLIYKSAQSDIQAVHNEAKEKITSSLSSSILNQSTDNDASISTTLVKNTFDFLIQKFSPKQKKQLRRQFKGTTYRFQTNQPPKFMIRRLTINSPESDQHINGKNIGFGPNITDKMNLLIQFLNQPSYASFLTTVTSDNSKQYAIQSTLKGGRIAQRKLFENDDIRLNFLENKSVSLNILGQISARSDILALVDIIQPEYRVINKSTNKNAIAGIVPFLNHQDLTFKLDFKGNLSAYEIEASSNLDELVKRVQTAFINKQMSAFKKEQDKIQNEMQLTFIRQTKDSEASFDKQYKKDINQMTKQKSELTNKLDEITNELNDKKESFKNNIKSELKQSLKSFGF